MEVFWFPDKDGEYAERNEVTCRVCTKRFKYCGNTSNMRLHLSSARSTEFAVMEKEENASLSKRKGGVSRSMASHGEPMPMDTGGVQQQLPAMLQAQKPIDKHNSRWKKLTDAICYFIAKDMMPFDTVNDPGFKHMVKTFKPLYTPPDRKTIATHYMQDLYLSEKRSIQQHLNDVEGYAITTDMWTSRAKQTYCLILSLNSNCKVFLYLSMRVTLQKTLLGKSVMC